MRSRRRPESADNSTIRHQEEKRVWGDQSDIQPSVEFSKAQADRAHVRRAGAARDAAGELYVVALPNPSGATTPEAVIEIAWANSHLGVWFFDAYGRQTLRYSFRRSNDQLFLGGITHWDYPDGSAATLSGAMRVDKFEFGEDGTASRLTSNDATRETSKEDRSGVDVANHWEQYPRFGDWASLARWKRGTPAS